VTKLISLQKETAAFKEIWKKFRDEVRRLAEQTKVYLLNDILYLSNE
jgi:hypothetical protein